MGRAFEIVDLFAGPGGLAEGFAAFRSSGTRPFKVAFSVEKERSAHQTLLLRSFLRQFEGELPPEYYEFINGGGTQPDWAVTHPIQWAAAQSEALHLELGSKEAAEILLPRVRQLREASGGNTIMIGGPPCQAYSLVGRARNRGIVGYDATKDERHFLYREYIGLLEQLRPAAFVMENVKGILSSAVGGAAIFERILADLSRAGGFDGSYVLVPMGDCLADRASLLERNASARDFVIRSELFGVPQARHRVIVVGVRRDVWERYQELRLPVPRLKKSGDTATVADVLSQLPPLRSGLSQEVDDPTRWKAIALDAMSRVLAILAASRDDNLAGLVAKAKETRQALCEMGTPFPRDGFSPLGFGEGCDPLLSAWIGDPNVSRLPNHASRGHMESDLARYFFVATFAAVHGVSPKAGEFPKQLAPLHANWETGKFADRFRAQMWDRPATTVTSHISKDGHYFVHPDPLQCRSLTVREAARLQTFPDNYFFMGNRTQQYVQVGNAVPPYLARQIAGTIWEILNAGSNSDPKAQEALAGGVRE